MRTRRACTSTRYLATPLSGAVGLRPQRGRRVRSGTTTVSDASKSREEETGAIKTAGVTVAVMLCFVVDGCAGSGGSQTSSDCQAQVRADGIVYTSDGHAEGSATKVSLAEEADCDDVGADPADSVFSESPRTVMTWTFADYPPKKVLGVRFGSTDSFAVSVANSVSDEERDRIYEDLASEGR